MTEGGWGLQAVPSWKKAENPGREMVFSKRGWSALFWAHVNTEQGYGYLEWLDDTSQVQKFLVGRFYPLFSAGVGHIGWL